MYGGHHLPAHLTQITGPLSLNISSVRSDLDLLLLTKILEHHTPLSNDLMLFQSICWLHRMNLQRVPTAVSERSSKARFLVLKQDTRTPRTSDFSLSHSAQIRATSDSPKITRIIMFIVLSSVPEGSLFFIAFVLSAAKSAGRGPKLLSDIIVLNYESIILQDYKTIIL